MPISFEDIYEYQFAALFHRVKPVIGRRTIKVFNTDEEEQADKELDNSIGTSNLLFDISGNDYKWFKACDSEYRYWVEVYVVKIIENLLTRTGKEYEEKYYSGCNEQHSIVYELDGKRKEAYFLFDIDIGESNRTNYDMIADVLKTNAQYVDKIEIFIFRDRISQTTLASLINESKEISADGLVEVLPLHCFFETLFGAEEYETFSRYADEFHARCNNIISYKTIITPTQRTLSAFKQKKSKMLREGDYLAIANKGQSGTLPEKEFMRVKNSFQNNKMYTAMVSTNDFADSFISAEWSYDVYSNSMGELELTGIIAGYLKSVEQLLFAIARFHRDQGIKIRTKEGAYKPYSTDNEENIDSTLDSLNSFIQKGKLALSNNIKGCIHKAVDLWRRYQRNGYFHKDNLYLKDNKIGEVRELTLYLYFLILGGITFSSTERQLLGVIDTSNKKHTVFDDNIEYPRFKKWLDNIIVYDLPEEVPGIWILITRDRDTWVVHPYLMKYFYIDGFESGSCRFDSEQIELNHVRDIPSFTWQEDDEDRIQASSHFKKLLYRYEEERGNEINRIQAIIMGLDRELQLIYFRQ